MLQPTEVLEAGFLRRDPPAISECIIIAIKSSFKINEILKIFFKGNIGEASEMPEVYIFSLAKHPGLNARVPANNLREAAKHCVFLHGNSSTVFKS